MKKPHTLNWIKFAAIAAVMFIGAWLAQLAAGSQVIQDAVAGYGYFGLFVISVAGGFNLFVVIPPVAFLPMFLVAGADLGISLIIMTVGMSLADSLSFLLGRFGRKLATGKVKKNIEKIEKLRKRYRLAPLILMVLWASFTPLPNEIIAIPLGLMGYRLLHVLPFLLVGNAVFNILTAYGVTVFFLPT